MGDFLALQELTADELNAHLGLFARKATDETVNNSATLQNDDHLLVSVVAGDIYELTARLVISSGTTPDFKFGWTFPSGLTMSYDIFEGETSTAADIFRGPFVQTDVPVIPGIGSNQPVRVSGLVVVGSTAGSLRLQWAQNTANASDTIVRANSYLILRKVD